MKNPANSKHVGRPKGEKANRVKPFAIGNVDELTRFWRLGAGHRPAVAAPACVPAPSVVLP